MAQEPNYWKSLRELHEKGIPGDAAAQEFMSGVTEDFSVSEMSGMSRKQFLSLLAASAAFAAAGCSDYRDKGEIVPYTKKPEEITPGVPNYYASTCTGCAQACGILIKTREGRPIKIDGNDEHPINRGKICAKGQASILNLYDPSRLRAPKSSSSGEHVPWKQVDDAVLRHLESAVQNGKEIAIVSRNNSSPTTGKVLDEFRAKYPTAKLYAYSVFHEENRRNAWQESYGTREIPVVEWERAKVIVALEADILGTDGMVMEQVRKFTDGRDALKSKTFNRLYCVEGGLSLTGANADYRLRLRPDAQLEFVLALIHEVEGAKSLSNISLQEVAQRHGLLSDTVARLVADLKHFRGESLVYAGSLLPEETHTAVNYLNKILGNEQIFKRDQHSVAALPLTSPEEFDALVTRMKTGQVEVLIHVDSNPVYHLPVGFGYASGVKSVPISLSLSETENETSELCTYVLPVHHAFESWGDHKVRTGVLSLQQPVIAPLYDSRQKESILLSWMKGRETYSETLYREYLKARWENEVYPSLRLRVDFTSFWYSSLHDGVITFDERASNTMNFDRSALPLLGMPEKAGITVALIEHPYLGDGSYANNGWLQELPHPVSKVVWDNYASISPKSAEALGLKDNDLAEVQLSNGKVTLPVLLQPGQADDFASISLGYGRTCAGPVGNNIGVNANILLPKNLLRDSRIITGAALRKVAGSHELVTTQEQYSLNDTALKDLHLKRKIIQEGTTSGYERDPDFLHKEKTDLVNIAQGIEYKGVKWAMAIDLNKCTGCNACVAGCNVENNIPVVGREQVAKGRSMHWIRLDRYYSGTDEAPAVSYQPMLCQHCDNAPCENVCPVAATNHSPDGLNQMVYNRCVGTKYCSNNCPYKVRRFNFFNWRNDFREGYYEQEPVSLVNNPEVTVRSRGVMEKCTFCIQRIMEARQHAIEEGRELKGSDVKTACQEACPSTAIVFGDMNDADSEVSRYRAHALGYSVLEELNTRPNVTYMAKLRNVEQS